ncbi:hypothetical protein ACFX2B_025121 [Malus domestica]
MLEHENRPGTVIESEVVGAGTVGGSLSQDSDPFNLLPIIKAVSKYGAKRSREDDDDAQMVIATDGLARMNKNPRSRRDHDEATIRGFRDCNEYLMLELSGYRGRPNN